MQAKESKNQIFFRFFISYNFFSFFSIKQIFLLLDFIFFSFSFFLMFFYDTKTFLFLYSNLPFSRSEKPTRKIKKKFKTMPKKCKKFT